MIYKWFICRGFSAKCFAYQTMHAMKLPIISNNSVSIVRCSECPAVFRAFTTRMHYDCSVLPAPNSRKRMLFNYHMVPNSQIYAVLL